MHGDSCDLLVGDGVPVGLDQRLVNVQSTGLSGPGSDRGLLFSAVRRERNDEGQYTGCIGGLARGGYERCRTR